MRRTVSALLFLATLAAAAPPSRVTGPVDARRVRALRGSVHRLAQPAFDRGAVAPGSRLEHVVLMTRMSAGQQAELDQLLAEQQNPSSPRFHQWLNPEEYGERFGLSASDHSKIVAWLTGEGFQVTDSARSRNWVAFRGTAAQVERSLRTPIHRFEVAGEMHMANTADPTIPEALAEVVEGFVGLDDFRLTPHSKMEPLFTSGGAHYMAPEDFATIYNLNPLYQAGLDGTGQSIAVVGQSAVLLTDMRAFRTRFNLPVNDPKLVLYGGADPGITSAQSEGNLDLQWAGAIAPKATLYYVYGANVFSAFLFSVSTNLAPIISISYGGCEIDYRPGFYRATAQQANAQGITILASSGDSGPACDRQGSSVAAMGRTPVFPTALPEITSVGGTQFEEGRGNYWAASNTANGGSALSYIPEVVWNETSVANGILSGGGGVSQFHPQPAWQAGAGLSGRYRQYPDVSFTAAVHDGYLVVDNGSLFVSGGTSASAPAMAGLVALMNQGQMAKGILSQPGLGNINPQLYRLAQAAPAVFHDTVTGDNAVPCAQGSPDCLTGTLGDKAVAGYDIATGLGSIDAGELIKNWDTAAKGVSVNLVLSTTRFTVNDTVYATALVSGAGGTPTGRVDFSLNGVPLGSAALTSREGQGQAADIAFPVYQLGGTGTAPLTAQYSGDAAFSTGGAVRNVTITAATGAAAITISAPATIWPSFPDGAGLSWQTQILLRDVGNTPSIVTGFRIDGQAQKLSDYFPSVNIPANGTVTVNVLFRNLAAPITRNFEVTGIDSNGRGWTRSIDVQYLGAPSSIGFYLTATPLTVTKSTADPACEWPVEINVDELDGRGTTLTALFAGGLLRTDVAAIFGTDRLAPWGSLHGTVCFNGIVAPATGYVQVNGANGFIQEVLVSFVAAPVAPVRVTATPPVVTLASPGTAQATVAVTASGQWTARVFPGNRMAGWLTVTPQSGTGAGQITLTANGSGYGPGAYRATVVIESANGAPQTLTVPVMFVQGAGTGMTIRSVGNTASGLDRGAPGGLLAIYGSGLATSTATASVPSAIPTTLAGVSVAVNGIAAPVMYVSPTQVNIQVPFEVGAGPAVIGLTSNGQVVGAHFQMAAAAPGIFADADGMLSPQKEIGAGNTATLLLTGAGEIASSFPTAFAVSPTTSLASAPKPLLPLSVTVGGVQAFVQTLGIAPGLVGVVQVNFIVPAAVAPGTYPVVVTVGGTASAPVNVTVK